MAYQLAFLSKAGVIVWDDALQLLDGLTPAMDASCLILNDILQDVNSLDVLGRILSGLFLNLCQLLLCAALFVLKGGRIRLSYSAAIRDICRS